MISLASPRQPIHPDDVDAADCRLPIADCRLPIANCRLPIDDATNADANADADANAAEGMVEIFDVGQQIYLIIQQSAIRIRQFGAADTADC